MRICLLSEIPQAWRRTVFHWSALNAKHRRGEWPDRNLEYFYYQTLVGAWRLPAERALPIMEKAAREAKQHTSWTEPNAAFDAALRDFVTGTLSDKQFTADVERFVSRLTEPGYINSLAETLLKLTTPGVPDTYQGDELWDLSLVDPDNRRPVDFPARQRLLGELKSLSVEQVWQRREEGLPKLWLTWKTLTFRRRHPELFGADSTYNALHAQGPKAAHVVAFSRGAAGGGVVTIVPRLVIRVANDWGETTLRLPDGDWSNELTGENVAGGERKVADLLQRFPVALLSGKEKP
jgi:(1->4)-alpha-D-glucan 1-alpha-D-glucosylmutase